MPNSMKKIVVKGAQIIVKGNSVLLKIGGHEYFFRLNSELIATELANDLRDVLSGKAEESSLNL